MTSLRVKLIEVERRERAYKLRMPFRFGVKTATHGRQAIFRVRIKLKNGEDAEGYSAEALGAKWFDKDLTLSDEQNYHQLRKSVELAGEAYMGQSDSTPFDLFAESYEGHVTACEKLALNPLIASFGQSMLDRAILDAVCRASEISFYEAMRSNAMGLRQHRLTPELDGLDLAGLFRDVRPAKSIHVRHTIGLADPILASDLVYKNRVNDGLPETLEEVVSFYGNRYFKIKIGGDETADLERLKRIASVLDRIEGGYHATLDGNEQFPDADTIASFYRKLCETPVLAKLSNSILCLEQPINRKEALTRTIDKLATLVPVIIDESDGALSSFVEARSLGYSGVSSKSCKGIYKSIVNHGRCHVWNQELDQRFFISAEDLTCEPGIAIQQDLALVNVLGLSHVERNAHHFIDGFDDRSESEARGFLAKHSDLYHEQDDRVRLKLQAGQFSIASLDCSGFASALAPDFAAAETMPPADWPCGEEG